VRLGAHRSSQPVIETRYPIIMHIGKFHSLEAVGRILPLPARLDGLHVWRWLEGHPESFLGSHLASFGVVTIILSTTRSILIVVFSSALRRSQPSGVAARISWVSIGIRWASLWCTIMAQVVDIAWVWCPRWSMILGSPLRLTRGHGPRGRVTRTTLMRRGT
jgi:hypothetical protein